jgi:hypothetical protein
MGLFRFILAFTILLSPTILIAAEKTGQPAADPRFVKDIWKNVRKVTADNRSFQTGRPQSVAGVRGKRDDAATGNRQPMREDILSAVEQLRVISDNPQRPATERAEACWLIGMCYMQLGDQANARQFLLKLERLYPRSRFVPEAQKVLKDIGRA